MKSKLLLALASLIIGMASFGANSVYADMTTGMPTQTQSRFCSHEAWNVFEPNCAGNITGREGKAAYGEPREVKMETTGSRALFCSTEGLNLLEPNCVGDIRK